MTFAGTDDPLLATIEGHELLFVAVKGFTYRI
jgi:hypothetical protein